MVVVFVVLLSSVLVSDKVIGFIVLLWFMFSVMCLGWLRF